MKYVIIIPDGGADKPLNELVEKDLIPNNGALESVNQSFR